MADRVTKLLHSKNIIPISIGDFVQIKELPTLSHINPKEACGIFVHYSAEDAEMHVNFNWRKWVIRYPLHSKLFNYMDPPFNYIIPSKNMLSSKYKVLKDPFYELGKPDLIRGTVNILERSHMRGNYAKDKSVYKVINLDKHYETEVPYAEPLKLSKDHFSGHVVQFLGHPQASSADNVKENIYNEYIFEDIHMSKRDGSDKRLELAIADKLDELRVKIVNIENIYLDIPLKFFNYA